MELQTVDGESWVRLDGLWHTELSAFQRALDRGRAASEVECFAAVRVTHLKHTDPANPEYDPTVPMALRVRAIAELGLPPDVDAETALAAAESAATAASANAAAVWAERGPIREALTNYAVERRIAAAPAGRFAENTASIARSIEQIRTPYIEALAGPHRELQIKLRGFVDQAERNWQAWLA